VGHDGGVFFAVFDQAPERGHSVGKLYPVVVVKKENAKPSETLYINEIFRAVGPVAEGGSEVCQAWNRKKLFWRSGQDRARKEKRNQEQEKEPFDPFEV
jgi:hypothetical protein